MNSSNIVEEILLRLDKKDVNRLKLTSGELLELINKIEKVE